MYQLILASQSPRRRDLLSKQHQIFRCDPVKLSENIRENLNPLDVVKTLAEDKSRAWETQFKPPKSGHFLVLTADTLVFVDGEALGKPRDRDQAAEFLRRMSGRHHDVCTGVCLFEPAKGERVSFAERSSVLMHRLDQEQIDHYLDCGEYVDKAGGYAIQGFGAELVSRMEGSRSNIIGLPMERLEKVLDATGWRLNRKSAAGTP